MASSDYDRRTSHDNFDHHTDRYDANSWGMVIGIAAVIGIIGMLFIGFQAGPQRPATEPTSVERTAPMPTAPSPTGPTTQPVTIPQ